MALQKLYNMKISFIGKTMTNSTRYRLMLPMLITSFTLYFWILQKHLPSPVHRQQPLLRLLNLLQLAAIRESSLPPSIWTTEEYASNHCCDPRSSKFYGFIYFEVCLLFYALDHAFIYGFSLRIILSCLGFDNNSLTVW